MRERGFTLIELMIVVTIIGILAAVAIPFYTSYVVRSKVTEGFLLVAPIKLAMDEIYAQGGDLPDDNAAAGLGEPDTLSGKYVQRIEVRENGVIVVTFDDPSLAGRTITITPKPTGNAILWTCGSDLPSNLLPSSCK